MKRIQRNCRSHKSDEQAYPKMSICGIDSTDIDIDILTFDFTCNV